MVAILGTSRHGKSLFINQMLRALELSDDSYNPSRRKDVWSIEEGPTATHAARHVARILCVEDDDRDRTVSGALKSNEEREDRFNITVTQTMKADPAVNKTEAGGIGNAKIIEKQSEHPRVTWCLPCGPIQGDDREEPGQDAVFNSKGYVADLPPLFTSTRV